MGIECEQKQQEIVLYNVSSALTAIAETESPLRVAIFSIINPSLSYTSAEFTTTFLKN